MQSFFRQITLYLLLIALFGQVAFGITDPLESPFRKLGTGEKILEGSVIAVTTDTLQLQDAAKNQFAVIVKNVQKFREGGGPADLREFATGDKVRFAVDAKNQVISVQNYELKLCDQNFYGFVRDPAEAEFRLEALTNESYRVLVGSTTQFRDEKGNPVFGYKPRAGDAVRVHGVWNSNSKQVFTDTFGAYVSLLSADALAPLAAQLAAASAATAQSESQAAAQFADVKEDNVFRRAIGFVKSAGIVAGYGDGSFRPDAQVNRAEFTKILIGATVEQSSITTPTQSCFPDVALADWFVPYVCLAKQSGVIAGYPDGRFVPANPVNLAEAIKIIVTSFDWSVAAAASGQAWYTPYLEKAQKLQILPAEWRDPSAPLTRGQLAELVTRAVKYDRGELVDYLASEESEK